MSKLGIIINGIVKENPTFVLMLGMCPTLATTTSALNGLMMGLATMVVLICSNIVIAAYLPDVNKSLGLFIPLIVVNCVILGRAESFAAKNTPLASACDGIGIGLGFTFGLTILGIFRELLGNGTIFNFRLLPEDFSMLVFILPPGAFLTLGFIIALLNRLKNK